MSKRIRQHKAGKLTVRSGFEAKVVEWLKKNKVKFEYESIKIKYTVPEKQHSYTPDFVLANGIIVEAKGIWAAADRLKMLLIKQQHPELDIRMLFMRNNPIRKGSKTSYGDYCDKHNILWAEKEIPEEWLS